MKQNCWLLLLIGLLLSCGGTDPTCPDCGENDELIGGDYTPRAYELPVPDHFPRPLIPADNPLTVAGVELGRRLFFETLLSSDNRMSCASCHQPERAFTDGLATSTGVRGLSGTRSSMSLANLAFNNRGFFWDGRVATLEAQAIIPVEDHRELNENWDRVEEKLRQHPDYPTHFRAAFGIDRRSEITRDLVVRALAQFERSLISADSKFDRVVWKNEGWFTEQEERGRELFFIEFAGNVDHPGCSHCHNAPLFGDNVFRNNGLDSVATLDQFTDPGRGPVSGNRFDNGAFRTPSLRNIALTAPYMHDGRFKTLEEVIDHYATGGHGVENEDANLRPFHLSDADKAALIAFLHTLTDDSFLTNPTHQSPF